MAMALRSHRTLSRICRSLVAISPSSSSSSSSSFSSGRSPVPPPQKWSLLRRSGASRSSPFLQSRPSSSSASLEPNHTWSYEDVKPRDLGVDEIEGCDFNHWLIVMDFPKDPKPSPEEMVRSFEQTCAKALDICEEEAKKKIYACSTSNYTGFHVEVTEAESEKFNGQPGVVFVLPDSYVDPEKKEYGGDKYINGVIIPRPRPTLNGRRKQDQTKHDQRGGQTADQQAILSYSHERTTQGGLKPNQQRNPPNSDQGPTLQSYPPKQNNCLRGHEVYVPPESNDRPTLGERRDPQNYSFDRNYNPVGQGNRRGFVPTVAPGERNYYQQGSGYPGNYNQMEPGNIYALEQRGCPRGDQRNYAAPSQQGGFMEDYRYYGPQCGSPYGQGAGGYQVQGTSEAYWHGANSDTVRHGTSFGYGQGYPRHIEGQSFSQQEQRNVRGASYYPQEQREFVQGYQRNYPYAPPPRCERCLREYYPNYGPPQVMPYGHRIGGYQVQGAPESYWEGTTFGYGQGYPRHMQVQGLPREQPRNMQGDHYYSPEPRDFRHANYAPPKHHEGFREFENYGPGQGTPYEQELGEYQGHGTPGAHWQGRKY